MLYFDIPADVLFSKTQSHKKREHLSGLDGTRGLEN